MTGVTEIYMCRPGQAVKEGQYVLSHDVKTQDQAKVDAINRCRLDRNLARIVYYGTTPDGKLFSLFTYENPELTPEPPDKSQVPDKGARRIQKVRRKPKPTLYRRVRAFFEEA